MKKIVRILGLLICIFFVGCESANDVPNGYIQTTEEGSSTLVLKGYESSSFGFSIFQKVLISLFILKKKSFMDRLIVLRKLVCMD